MLIAVAYLVSKKVTHWPILRGDAVIISSLFGVQWLRLGFLQSAGFVFFLVPCKQRLHLEKRKIAANFLSLSCTFLPFPGRFSFPALAVFFRSLLVVQCLCRFGDRNAIHRQCCVLVEYICFYAGKIRLANLYRNRSLFGIFVNCWIQCDVFRSLSATSWRNLRRSYFDWLVMIKKEA